MRTIALTCVLAAGWCLAADPSPGGSAEEVATRPTTRPWVLQTTYADRIRASVVNRAADQRTLALPHPHADNVMPRPVLVEPRRRAIVYPDLDWVIWRVVPAVQAHETYLERRKDLLAEKDPMAVVDWCEGQKLPACAEFELRRLLHARRNPRDPAYQAALGRWIPHAADRVAAYTFPLPLEGEWHVARDATDHHQAKAGAYHAVDLVVKHNGSMRRPGRGGCDNYYAFGRPVMAQADGLVRMCEDKFPDVPPGKPGEYEKANTLVVDYGAGIQALYGHLKQGSLQVRSGQRVSAGQKLAEVGNSGASGVPHLHYALMDHAHFTIGGRYRMEVRRGNTWTAVDEGELEEATTVRNVEGVFDETRRPTSE